MGLGVPGELPGAFQGAQLLQRSLDLKCREQRGVRWLSPANCFLNRIFPFLLQLPRLELMDLTLMAPR